MIKISRLARHLAAALGLALAAVGGAQADGTVGTSFPSGFVLPVDYPSGDPLFGFGGDKTASPVTRTPVIFLHGNGGTPYNDTSTCASFGADIQRMAQYFADNGYSTSELWAVGWQGRQCQFTSLGVSVPAYNASWSHAVGPNVADLRAFVQAVLRYTGASRVDIVAHDIGAVLAREWVRQDVSRKLVRKFVAIDAPNGGMAICSAATNNPWALGGKGGFTPDSPLCQELGSPDTPFLKALNKAADGARISPADTLVIRNGDSSFLFFPRNDGVLVSGAPGINANSNSVYDSYGVPTDFTTSAAIRGGAEITLTGQHGWDYNQGTAHVGIANSPTTWQAALSFMMKK